MGSCLSALIVLNVVPRPGRVEVAVRMSVYSHWRGRGSNFWGGRVAGGKRDQQRGSSGLPGRRGRRRHRSLPGYLPACQEAGAVSGRVRPESQNSTKTGKRRLLAISRRTSRALLGTRTQVSSRALNKSSAFRLTTGGLKGCLNLRGIGVIQAETLSVGNHFLEGQFGLAALPPAVVKEVIEPYLAVTAGLVEGDHACSSSRTSVVRDIRSKSAASWVESVRWCGATVTARPAFHGSGDLQEHLEHRLGKLDALAVRTRQSRP